MGLLNEGSEQLVDFLRRENLVLVRRERWGEVLGREQALYRVRTALQDDVYGERDSHGRLQKYLDLIDAQPDPPPNV